MIKAPDCCRQVLLPLGDRGVLFGKYQSEGFDDLLNCVFGSGVRCMYVGWCDFDVVHSSFLQVLYDFVRETALTVYSERPGHWGLSASVYLLQCLLDVVGRVRLDWPGCDHSCKSVARDQGTYVPVAGGFEYEDVCVGRIIIRGGQLRFEGSVSVIFLLCAMTACSGDPVYLGAL